MVKAKLQFIEHHRSHLASAFYSSPYEEAAILSIDGSGDFTTTMLGRGKGTDIEVLESVDFPASVGLFYTAFTQFLGFPHYGDEYKVMGLAPYGTPHYVDQVAQVLPLKEKGLYHWKPEFFNFSKGVVSYPNNLPTVAPLFGRKFEALFGPARTKGEELTQYHMDLAASVQRHTEEVIFHVLRRLHELTGLARVCIAGGVAQNSVANGKITRNTLSRRFTFRLLATMRAFPWALPNSTSTNILGGPVPPPCSVLTQEASLETTRWKPI